MKTVLFLCLTMSAAVSFGQTTSQSTSRKKSTAPTATTPIVIPKTAKLEEDGFYHYTDSKGKKWLYRNTPFGVSRALEAPPAAPAPVEEDHLTKATVVGDTVKFERPNVFGVSKWEKKTSDLTDDEKKIVENQKAKQQ